MAIQLNKQEGVFRNELILTADAKAVNIDNVLVNLFMLLRFNGIRPRQRGRRGESAIVDLDKLKEMFIKLGELESFRGFKENPEAVELWLRTNLVNMVYRGNMEKEKISSLRPIHLESYRIRNAKNTRDYFAADQVYLMLGQNLKVKEDLKSFLVEGWDKTTNELQNSKSLDIDGLGILQLVKEVNPGFLESSSSLNKIRPLLEQQASLFCEDIRRLLVYRNRIPRNVIIEYLKTITSFHLALYVHKIIYLLPKMVEEGSTEVKDDWTIVIDATDDLESRISKIAIVDAERTYNSLYEYFRATFKINMIIQKLKLDASDSNSIVMALSILKNHISEYEERFEVQWDNLVDNQNEEDKEMLEDWVKYEPTFFEKYIEAMMRVKGAYQNKYYPQFLDNLCQKNSERGFLAQGRSKKHPRRYVMGTRLLEALVQLQVLRLDGDHFVTRNLSIEEMLKTLKERYGIIINGLEEERFKNIDVDTRIAFQENVEAFKMKLRQIGFYDDLSDAYILQKIRPRYELS